MALKHLLNSGKLQVLPFRGPLASRGCGAPGAGLPVIAVAVYEAFGFPHRKPLFQHHPPQGDPVIGEGNGQQGVDDDEGDSLATSLEDDLLNPKGREYPIAIVAGVSVQKRAFDVIDIPE